MKKTLVLGVLLFSFPAFSQNGFGSSGGEGNGSGGSISSSIGQLSFEEIETSSGKISPGVQQPYEFFLLSFEEEFYSVGQFKAFPNPTTDLIYLETPLKGAIKYSVFDTKGALLISGDSQSSSFLINCKDLPQGSYSLVLRNTTMEPTTMKFLKR